tara:strand:+ start:974 stop:1855 length:882 start_codon:yes stop_codon:yes gene_type:complete
MKKLTIAVLGLFLTACQGDRLTTSSPGDVEAPFAESVRTLTKHAGDGAAADTDTDFTDPASPHLGTIDGDYAYDTALGLTRVSSTMGYNGWDGRPVDRPMIKTVSGGFEATDFIAELTVTETDLTQSKDLIYFGFGAGEANPSHFDEPTNSIYLRIHNNTGSWKGVHASHHTGITSGTSVFDEIGSYDPTGTTFRIEKSGDDVTLSIVGVTGASQTFSLSAIASVLDGTNGHIFFGNSAEGTTFSDLVVSTPEPEPPTDPETKADCKKGGWQDYGFRNQGQCVRFVQTGKDSR